jgi:beta-glucosidase
MARQEYVAVGIRSSLHPQIDLGTEPRWGRQFHTFGNDSAFVAEVASAYIEGFQLDRDLGPSSVATMAKHFPGGGPQLDGEDPHFPYGREQVYPGGRFDDHLVPFRRAIEVGTSALMPYYGRPMGLELDGEAIEEVGFGYNKQILTGLLRDQLGYDGVICTDWGLVTGTVVFGRPLPARAWGVEHLSELDRLVKIIDAGADQLGGEARTDLLIQAVEQGLITSERIDASVRRLLLVKFQLGLFDDPFVDPDRAEEIVGREDFVRAGRRAQAESMVLLHNADVDGVPTLPLTTPLTVYVEGIPAEQAAQLGEVVADPADADVAVVRLPPPFEPRDDLFLEGFFHQGSLEYRPGLVYRLRELAAVVPLVIDANLERPAILTPFTEFAAAILTDVGASSSALVEVLTGTVAPLGRLPFEVPRSTEAVQNSHSDVADDSEDPLYPHGAGLRYS